MVRTTTSRPPQDEAQTHESGFTLFELMIVMAIIAILASVAIPSYINAVRHGREAALRQDLWVMRQAIDSYTVDKEKAPQSLDDLVQSGYLKAIPVDPMTGSSDTWMPDTSDTLMDIDQTAGGINNVHSAAQGLATDGSSYNTW
jgi:general secretion pathway protein G